MLHILPQDVLPYTCHIRACVRTVAVVVTRSSVLPIFMNLILFSLHVAVYSRVIVIYTGCELFHRDLLSCSP